MGSHPGGSSREQNRTADYSVYWQRKNRDIFRGTRRAVPTRPGCLQPPLFPISGARRMRRYLPRSPGASRLLGRRPRVEETGRGTRGSPRAPPAQLTLPLPPRAESPAPRVASCPRPPPRYLPGQCSIAAGTCPPPRLRSRHEHRERAGPGRAASAGGGRRRRRSRTAPLGQTGLPRGTPGCAPAAGQPGSRSPALHLSTPGSPLRPTAPAE